MSAWSTTSCAKTALMRALVCGRALKTGRSALPYTMAPSASKTASSSIRAQPAVGRPCQKRREIGHEIELFLIDSLAKRLLSAAILLKDLAETNILAPFWSTRKKCE